MIRSFAMHWLRNLCSVALTALLLAACGGGGSGQGTSFGNTIPPDSGPGDAELFFPNSTGDAWYYDTVTTPPVGPQSRSLERIVVSGQQVVLGQTASVFQDTVIDDPAAPGTPTGSYYYKNAGGLAFMGDDDPSDTAGTQFAPYVEALFPLSPATVASFGKNGVNIGVDLDGDGRAETANLTLTAKVVDFEPLDTAIGSLQRTVKTSESLDGSIILSSGSSSVPFTSLTTTWSAPGIGIVKRTVSVTVQGKTQQLEFDIRGYVAEGKARGLTTPYVLEDGLAGASLGFSPTLPALASDGTNFLSVVSTANGLQGTLFDSNAKVLGTLALGSGSGAVSFDGTNYLVAVNTVPLTVHRVTPAGVDLDAPNGISLATGLTPGEFPAIASGSANSLIVYSKYDSPSAQHLLYGVLVDHNGQALPPGEISIAVDDATHLFPQVSFDGSNYLVVWQQSPQSGEIPSTCHINAARVSATGTVLDVPSIAVSTALNGQFNPVVAFDGSNYFVVWQDGRNTTADPNTALYDLYGARVAPSGQVIDSGGLPIDIGGKQHRQFQSIVYSGTGYLVAWSDFGYAAGGSTGIRLAHLAADGTVSSAPGGLLVSGTLPSDPASELFYPVMASHAGTTALAWIDLTQDTSLLAVMGYSL
jgi:hypothetical protein